MLRRTLPGFAALAYLSWIVACSSGLGNNLPAKRTVQTASSSNLPVGLDVGFAPTAPLEELAVAGVVVPAIGTRPARELALLGFTTTSRSDNGDGNGALLARDPTTDTNGVADVFVALVSAADIEPDAFCQRLAGKFRHPRCATCHSMAVPGTLAFTSSPQAHAGPPPGSGFPINEPASCVPCHVTSTNAPVPGWMAPGPSFDIRSKTVAQLAQMALNPPIGENEHFVTDKRVIWALDSGVLPAVNGRNGIADDNHDGVFEPEDVDGIIRTVPGGMAALLADLAAWEATGERVDNAAAVRDITLVSRAANTSQAGNGASNNPRLLYVPNPSFNPTNATTAAATNPIGRLFVAFTSTASNLVAGDTNGVSDVFRAVVELRAEEDALGNPLAGGLSLRADSTATILASAVDGALTPGNGAARAAAIGGSQGEWIAFESLATNLVAGFVDGNGAGEPDVFLRYVLTSTTTLVSHTASSTSQGANGPSLAPSVDPRGQVVAYESDATDLVGGDTNSVRDVFYTRIANGLPYTQIRASVGPSGAQASGGNSGRPSVHEDGAGRVLVAFESAKTDLAPVTAASNVFVYDSDLNHSMLANQIRTAGMPQGTPGNGPARSPQIAADGSVVCFVSSAKNIDVLRDDDNRHDDIFLAEIGPLQQGLALPYRVSIGMREAGSADGSSSLPVFGTLHGSNNFVVGCVAYTTLATNLGTSDSTPIMVSFLNDTSGVLTEFSASVVRGAIPLTVQFTDLSTGSPTEWEWDFDNSGNVDSRQQNPLHIYRQAGTYSVRLTARNRNSGDTRIAAGLIRAIGPSTVDFTASVVTGGAPLAVNFNDTSTEEPHTWAWDFDNDGVVDATTQNPSHSYTTPGTYSVRLTVTNEAGTATRLRTNLISVFAPVNANFSATPLLGQVPLQVTFTDLTTGAADAWAWDFDNDGIVDSTARNPVHTYSSPGIYSVALTASGPGGTDTELKTSLIAVGGPVVANFTASATREYSTTPIQFTDTSTGTVTSWAWDFNNDGVVDSVLQNPIHTFTVPGVYSVRLAVAGPGGTDDELKNNFFTSVPTSVAITLNPSQDTSIYSDQPSNSNGGNQQLVCGNAATMTAVQVGVRRALVEFDISGSLPAGATILTAQLQLTNNFNPTNPIGNQTVSLHRVNTAWGEAATNGGIGVGFPATTGDATWAEAISGSFAWTTAGGDFVATPRASTTVGGVGVYNWSGANLVSDVQAWLDTPSGNHGWIVRSAEVSGVRSAKVFGSREAAVPAERPRLNLTYRPAL